MKMEWIVFPIRRKNMQKIFAEALQTLVLQCIMRHSNKRATTEYIV